MIYKVDKYIFKSKYYSLSLFFVLFLFNWKKSVEMRLTSYGLGPREISNKKLGFKSPHEMLSFMWSEVQRIGEATDI